METEKEIENTIGADSLFCVKALAARYGFNEEDAIKYICRVSTIPPRVERQTGFQRTIKKRPSTIKWSEVTGYNSISLLDSDSESWATSPTRLSTPTL